MIRKLITIILLLSFACSPASEDNSVLLQEANSYSAKGQHEQAIKILEKILDNEPDSSLELLCMNNLCYSNGKLGDYYEEISLGERIIEKYPKLPDGYTWIAHGFTGLQKYDLALEKYWTATQLDTGSMTAFVAAILADDYKKPELAIKFYQECIKRDSLSINAYHNLMVDLVTLKEFEKAKKYCEIFRRLHPNNQSLDETYKYLCSLWQK